MRIAAACIDGVEHQEDKHQRQQEDDQRKTLFFSKVMMKYLYFRYTENFFDYLLYFAHKKRKNFISVFFKKTGVDSSSLV